MSAGPFSTSIMMPGRVIRTISFLTCNRGVGPVAEPLSQMPEQLVLPPRLIVSPVVIVPTSAPDQKRKLRQLSDADTSVMFTKGLISKPASVLPLDVTPSNCTPVTPRSTVTPSPI